MAVAGDHHVLQSAWRRDRIASTQREGETKLPAPSIRQNWTVCQAPSPVGRPDSVCLADTHCHDSSPGWQM